MSCSKMTSSTKATPSTQATLLAKAPAHASSSTTAFSSAAASGTAQRKRKLDSEEEERIYHQQPSLKKMKQYNLDKAAESERVFPLRRDPLKDVIVPEGYRPEYTYGSWKGAKAQENDRRMRLWAADPANLEKYHFSKVTPARVEPSTKKPAAPAPPKATSSPATANKGKATKEPVGTTSFKPLKKTPEARKLDAKRLAAKKAAAAKRASELPAIKKPADKKTATKKPANDKTATFDDLVDATFNLQRPRVSAAAGQLKDALERITTVRASLKSRMGALKAQGKEKTSAHKLLHWKLAVFGRVEACVKASKGSAILEHKFIANAEREMDDYWRDANKDVRFKVRDLDGWVVLSLERYGKMWEV